MGYPSDARQYPERPPDRNHRGYGPGVQPDDLQVRRGIPLALNVVVGILGILGFCLGFAPYSRANANALPSTDDTQNFFDNAGGAGVAGLSLILAAGLIALLSLLPRQAANAPSTAGLSLAGFISLLFVMIGLDTGLDTGVGLVLVLVASFLQAALAVCSLLAAAGVLRLGAADRYGAYPPPRDSTYRGQSSRPPYRGPGPR